jgi:ribonuclease VapC
MPITIDTSALTAIVFGETDAERFSSALLKHVGDCALSAATMVEATIVAEARQGPAATQDLRLLIDQIGAEIVPVDAEIAAAAVAAWRRFGKGRHAAALNFGDCFSYAVAKVTATALLYKGDDFTQTDIASAL